MEAKNSSDKPSGHKRAVYAAVSPTEEDREELLSSTDVEEDPFMGDSADAEKQWRDHRWLRRDGDSSCRKSNRPWIISTVLQIIIIIMLAVLLLREKILPENAMVEETPQVAGVFTGHGPTFDTMIIKFNADSTFVPSNASEFRSKEVLERWRSTLPAGAGWATDKDTFTTTTMTHQLHCLYMMGKIYSGLVTSRNSSDNSMLPDGYHAHFMHCIDYIRQGVMCTADIATEPHTPEDPDDLGPLDGSWGGLHVCKDYSQVTKFLEKQIADGVRVVLPIDD